ncbi:MAG: hypothetical protein LBM23_10975 [Propionibacteriaceae bacterium]|jgi:hypothetical protein|nr:hypothetical protein [Propionibacteriaceae bacterium]
MTDEDGAVVGPPEAAEERVGAGPRYPAGAPGRPAELRAERGFGRGSPARKGAADVRAGAPRLIGS